MLKLKNILKFAFLYFYMFEFGGLHWSPLINTSLPLPPEDSEPEANPCWNLDPGLSSLQNYEKMFLLFKSSSLWCFAMAA